MRPRTLIFALLALLLGGGTIFLVQKWMAEKEATMVTTRKPVEAPRTYVLVAARSVSAGDFIVPAALRWQSWPDAEVPRSYIVRTQQGQQTSRELVGAVARRTISEGEPILAEMTVKAGERGFLAAVLWPGMRAVSVPVNEAASVSGLVFPGDRVDVILTRTHRVGTNRTSFSSETLLQNVRVLAIGTHTTGPAPAPASGRGGSGGSSNRGARTVSGKTATLELPPDQVEALMVAQSLGRLSMSLRSLSDEEALDRFRKAVDAGALSERPATGDPKVTLAGDARTGGAAERKRGDEDGKGDGEGDGRLRHDKPVRGNTLTTDAEVSRSVRRSADPGRTVIVFRGNKSQKVAIGSGGGEGDDGNAGGGPGPGTGAGTGAGEEIVEERDPATE